MERQKHTALRKDASLNLDVTENLKSRDCLKLHNLSMMCHPRCVVKTQVLMITNVVKHNSVY
jgi:hypothetical protein